jgi:hypothetical protein
LPRFSGRLPSHPQQAIAISEYYHDFIRDLVDKQPWRKIERERERESERERDRERE